MGTKDPAGEGAGIADTNREGAVLIGRGKSGDVLRLRDGMVLKLFSPAIPRAIVEREFRALTAIRNLGIRSADPVEILSIDGQCAIRSTFVPGSQVLDRVKRNPIGMTWALARLAWQHARLHAVRVDGGELPDGKMTLAARIATSRAEDRTIRVALACLAGLPDGDRLCHGDLHLGNIIAESGRWTIVDWARATIGAPAGDAARTRLLIRFGSSHFTDRFLLIRMLRWVSAHFYASCYCMFARIAPARLREWELPVAVAWMQGQDSYRAEPLARFIARRTALISNEEIRSRV